MARVTDLTARVARLEQDRHQDLMARVTDLTARVARLEQARPPGAAPDDCSRGAAMTAKTAAATVTAEAVKDAKKDDNHDDDDWDPVFGSSYW